MTHERELYRIFILLSLRDARDSANGFLLSDRIADFLERAGYAQDQGTGGPSQPRLEIALRCASFRRIPERLKPGNLRLAGRL